MCKPILLFDLGNTLVEYFRRGGFTPVLRESIRLAGRALGAAGHPLPSDAEVERRVEAESHDARNHRVRPLHRRLARVFPRCGDPDDQLMHAMCRAFMGPIAALRSLVDLEPTLQRWYGTGNAPSASIRLA